MVVDAVAARVVHGIGECVPAEGHVADRGGEAAVRYPGGFEAFVADLGRGVEQRGDGAVMSSASTPTMVVLSRVRAR